MKILYGAAEIAGALSIMATDILASSSQEPALIGIRRGGLILSDRLAELMEAKSGRRPLQAVLDINLYRDDWTRVAALPRVGRTELPFSLDGLRVVLVDDVLYTGRTVRAALEALVEFGRPARIELAVLVDRGGREMPIEANYASFKIPVSEAQRVNVNFQGQGDGRDEVVLD